MIVPHAFETFARVFRNPSLRRLQLASGAATLGGSGYQIGLAAVAFTQGGASAVGIAFAVQLVPLAVAAPFTSVLADRYSRRRVLLWIDAFRVLCTASVATAVSQDAPLTLVLALGAPGAVASTAQDPATQALLPELVREPAELTAANVTARGLAECAGLAGPALAGLILVVADPALVFAAGAACFALSGILVAGIAAGRERPQPSDQPVRRRHDAVAGLQAVVHDHTLRLLIGLVAVLALVTGLLQVFVVLIARSLLGLGASTVGVLFAAVGVGGLLGTVIAAALAGQRRLSWMVALGMALVAVSLAAIALSPSETTATVGLAVVGAGSVLADVGVLTLLQRAAPEDVLARVFGVAGSALLLMVGIGSLLGPALNSALGGRPALAIVGAIPAGAMMLAWPRLRAADAAAPEIPERVALLRTIEMFAGLPQDTLESLATRLRRLDANAGQTIIRQGDAGEHYYVVRDGACEARVDGTLATIHRRGDGFGEIALVRDIPRTATVTALEDSTLYTLERTAFLAAITGHTRSATAAESLATARLERLRPLSS